MPLRLPVDQLVELIDRVVDARYGTAEAEVAEIRARYPAAGPSQISHILVKLGLRDRTQAVVFAYEARLVPR